MGLKISSLSDVELETLNKGKKKWNLDSLNSNGGGLVNCKTIKYLVEKVIENTWLNAKMFYENKNTFTFKNVELELPIVYETGVFDGRRSDFVLAKNNLKEFFILRTYECILDGNNILIWCDKDDNEIPNIVEWCKI